MRYLNKRNDFLSKRQSDSLLLNEAQLQGGPFANDVGWNDSLLGRLINHTIRKARIKANMLRMKPLIERLKEEFDKMVDESVLINNPDIADESFKVFLYTIFKEIKDAIEKGEEVSVLKSLTTTAISAVNKLDKFDKKEVILQELTKFKEFLDTLEDKDAPSEEENTEKDVENPPYVVTVENLKALSALLASIVKPENKNPNQVNEELTNIRSTTKRQLEDIRKNRENKTQSGTQSGPQSAPQSQSETSGTQSGTQSQPQPNNEVFTTLNNALIALESTRNSKFSIGVTKEMIDSLIATKDKNLTRNFYREVLKQLNKNTVNESADLFKDKNRMPIIAGKLATFIKVALTLEGKSTGKENDNALKSFISSIKKIIDSYKVPTKSEEPKEEPKVEPKKEGLMRYSDFIREANEDAQNTDGQNTESQSQNTEGQNTGESDNKIKTFFEQQCKEVNSFVVSDEEFRVLSEKIKTLEESNKNLTFTMDPVLEIMALFIRAYKIYTVQTITKRSENVDTNTLSEYTSFGSGGGADSGRQGPYRNNKLFDMWEDAVRDIMKNRKYQVLFTKNASLRLPKVTNPSFSKKEDWELKPDAGVQFRKFINEMLDGDKLYRSGSDKGKVSAFVNQYFGETATNPDKIATAPDAKAVAELQAEIDKNTTKLKLEKIDVSVDKIEKYTLFATRLTDKEGDKTQRGYFITDVDANYVYVSYALIKTYNNYFDKLGNGKKVIEVGTFPVPLAVGSSSTHHTKIKKSDFYNLFKEGNKLNFKNADNQAIVSNDVYTVTSDVYWLVKEDNTLFKVEDSEKILEVIKNSGDKVTKNLVDPNNCIITIAKTETQNK